MKNYYVYILTNEKNGTLYIGITSNLIKRIQQHRNKIADGFTKRYNIYKLIYYEQTENINSALIREKALKKWNRNWKIRLIEESNPNWRDLYFNIIQ